MKETETFACTHCGAVRSSEELHTFEGELYCRDCMEALTEVCDYYDERFWNTDLHHEQSLSFGRSCLDDAYSYCSGYSRLMPASSLKKSKSTCTAERPGR